MKNLSKKEWLGVTAGVIFVGYTLFGADIMSLFQNEMPKEDSLAASVPSEDSNGVIVSDIVVGTGKEARLGNLVSAHYILSLTDGTTIQNSKDFGTPFTFTLGSGEAIPGWDQGIAGMKVGGVRTIIIPPALAYGANQNGPIPPNSTLIFTIELVDVTEVAPEVVQ